MHFDNIIIGALTFDCCTCSIYERANLTVLLYVCHHQSSLVKFFLLKKKTNKKTWRPSNGFVPTFPNAPPANHAQG